MYIHIPSDSVFASLAGAVVMGPVAIVVVAGIVVNGGGVAMVMGPDVHGRALPQNVTSARCTQSEPPGRNCRVTTGSLMLIGMHTLTRAAQEVFWGLINDPTGCGVFCILAAAKVLIVCTPIPFSGQLNITTSYWTIFVRVVK